MPTVRKAMTHNLISIKRTAGILEAEALMLEKRIRHLPVLDDNGDIVGLLSHRDFLSLQRKDEMNVEQVMSSPVQFVHIETPLRAAIYKMLEKKISCLLISDSDDEVVGIMTTDDLLWYLTHLLDEEDKPHRSLRGLFDLQGASRVTQQISDMGI